MGGLYRKKRGKSAGRERPRIKWDDYIGRKEENQQGKERPRIEWEDYLGRKEERLQEEKGVGLSGRII